MPSIPTNWNPQGINATNWNTQSTNASNWQEQNLLPAQGYILLQDGISHILLQNGTDKLKLE